MRLDKLHQLALEHRVGFFDTAAGGLDDEGFGDFAFAVAGDADDDDVGDGGVGEEVGFDCGRRKGC